MHYPSDNFPAPRIRTRVAVDLPVVNLTEDVCARLVPVRQLPRTRPAVYFPVVNLIEYMWTRLVDFPVVSLTGFVNVRLVPLLVPVRHLSRTRRRAVDFPVVDVLESV